MAEALANIVPNEVVPLGTAIEVTSREPFDPRSAQAAIRLLGERTVVRLSDDGRTASVLPADGRAHGAGMHVLVLDEPLSADGDRLADRVVIPFLVADTRADLPQDAKVETMVRLAVDDLRARRLPVHERPEGAYMDVLKVSDRKTGEALDLAFDDQGQAHRRRRGPCEHRPQPMRWPGLPRGAAP